jgi:hypothetical protein
MARRAGFEPATSRVANDVTAIFTTDRAGSWRGTIDAVAALAGTVFQDEVTGIFTTALLMCSHLQSKGHAGEQAMSAFSDVNTGASFRKTCAVARGDPCLGTSTVRDAKGGIRTRFTVARSIRDLHHQRSLSRTIKCGKQNEFAAALACAAVCEPLEVRSAIGIRLVASFPPAGPARLGTRVSARAPGSGSPVPAFAGPFPNKPCSGQQKTLRSSWLGRVRVQADCSISQGQARSLP